MSSLNVQIKLCIWMNIPSHYQSAFFAALDHLDDVDLSVVYFNGASQDRAEEGWSTGHDTQRYEMFSDRNSSVEMLVDRVPEWRDRIHIISGNFSPLLVDWFCGQGIPWCHWSETPGIRLADLLGYRMPLFRLLNPLMLLAKRREGRLIRNHALGAFGQGRLAHQAFKAMGVPDKMISDLYYSPEGLEQADPSTQIQEFSNGRKIYLAVGALCRRKGIDVLLKAFGRLKTDDWCVVLCGLDRAEGAYQALARKLGIRDSVLFLGAYPVERMAEVYTAADVFVLASRFDGWGAVLNEAASLGIPIIGSDLCGASWHIVRDGETGFRVRAGSVQSLKNAMNAYVNNSALAPLHGRSAAALFGKDFTPMRNAERCVRALQSWSRP